MWGRQSYRLSEMDFEANAKDGIAIDWPIRYKDLAPWYSYVEKFAGISGNKDGLPNCPTVNFAAHKIKLCGKRHIHKNDSAF